MGAMGKGLFYQTTITPGFKCVGVADLDVGKARKCVEELGQVPRVVQAPSEVYDAIRADCVAVCQDGLWLAQLEGVDAFLESTSAITAAGRYALTALEHGMHLVLMNAEIDLIFGPYLMHRAHELGLTYTSCDGDQHGVIKRLLEDLELWGFQPVMGGNVKGFLDRYSNPTKIIPEADKRNLDYRMCTAYTDGTKLNIEMALLANALNMKTAVPGMQGPRAAHVHDALRLFDLHAIWDRQTPVVDYVLGAQPDGGVFAVGYHEHPFQQALMKYYKMGPGPYYVFYRPYHLCHVEAMECVADAVLDGKSLLEPTAGFRTNVFAYAKKDLRAGDTLDGLGGYACYGLIENCPTHGAPQGLPICLAEDLTLLRDVAQDQPILLQDVRYDPHRYDFDLYHQALRCSAQT
jgi:predicted homoserine dehydrogenase-like protein